MFGIGKKKVIDQDLMYKNVAAEIVRILHSDNENLLKNFAKISPFSQALVDDSAEIINRLLREKMVLLCAFASILISKETGSKNTIGRLMVEIEQHIDDEWSKAELMLDVGAIVDLRTTLKPKDAGREIEHYFAVRVFDIEPSNDDVDANYLLYKTLSSLERTMIFQGASAIRKAKK